MKLRLYLPAILIGFAAAGQTLPKIIPPAPEATTLAKNVEFPISHYNGTPVISYPFYTIRQGGVEVPISLDYNAKGNQVNEIASRVGLGWSLNAGGVITRQVRTRPDEATGYNGYLTTNFIYDFATNASRRAMLYTPLPELTYETDPDLFIFNFLGYSGKFIFDNYTKQPVLQTAANLTITYAENAGVISSFIITDEKGNKYYFNTPERATHVQQYSFSHKTGGGMTDGGNDPFAMFPGAWYLSHIRPANSGNNQISFEYEDEQVRYYRKSDDVKNPDDNDVVITSFSYTHTNQKQLKAIYFNEGAIHFDSGASRSDLDGGKVLQGIRLVDNHGTYKKHYLLSHYYTTSSENTNMLGFLKLDNYAKSRLFLDKITEKKVKLNSNSADYVLADFTYNPIVLPSRHSTSIDSWGYYNGLPNRECLDNIMYPYKRIIDFTKSAAGILTRIDHPTGGHTEYVYEHNIALPPDFADEITILPNNPVQYNVFAMSKAMVPYENNAHKKYFTIEGSDNVMINAKVLYNAPVGCLPGQDSHDCNFAIFIKKADAPLIPIRKLLLGQSTFSLAPGNYFVEVRPEAPYDPSDWEDPWDVYLKWFDQVVDQSGEIYAGGKRIKSIKKYQGETLLLQKDYNYNYSNGKTSGHIFCVPNYIQDYEQQNLSSATMFAAGPMTSPNNGNIGYSRVTETSIGEGSAGKTEYVFTNPYDTGEFYKFPFHFPNDMSWLRGKPLIVTHYSMNDNVYRKVKSIRNQYVVFDDAVLPDGGDPYDIIPIDDDGLGEPWDNLPEPQHRLNLSTGQWEVLSLPYLRGHRKSRLPMYSFKPYFYQHDQPLLGPDDYKIAYFYSGRVDLAKTVETDYFYDSSGTLPKQVVTTKTFTYDSPVHHQLTSQTIDDSMGDVTTTTYSYPQDANMAAEPKRNQLVAANMHVPLVTKTVKSGTTIDEQRVEFEDWGNGYLAPKILKFGKNGTLETRIRYVKVDPANGNPLEVQMENGVPVSYLWGYNNSRPVAQIEGLPYNAIPPLLIKAIEDQINTSPYNEAAVLAKLDELRNNSALAGAMVTTYTYDMAVGVSTVTDPNGIRAYYVYDEFNRLKYVKDTDNNILSEYEYHYTTQQ